jgi:hypothetical protein
VVTALGKQMRRRKRRKKRIKQKRINHYRIAAKVVMIIFQNHAGCSVNMDWIVKIWTVTDTSLASWRRMK